MSFPSLQFTNKGRALVTKALAGTELKFTKLAMGDGKLTTQAIADMTVLVNKIYDVSISEVSVKSQYAIIKGIFTNAGIPTGFYWREIGVFAEDPVEGEILFAYSNAYSLAEYISSAGEEIIEKVISVPVYVSTAETVSAVIDSSLVYATVEDILGLAKEETLQEILTALTSLNIDLTPITSVLGATTDIGGSTTGGTIMAKLNESLESKVIKVKGSTAKAYLQYDPDDGCVHIIEA